MPQVRGVQTFSLSELQRGTNHIQTTGPSLCLKEQNPWVAGRFWYTDIDLNHVWEMVVNEDGRPSPGPEFPLTFLTDPVPLPVGGKAIWHIIMEQGQCQRGARLDSGLTPSFAS